MTIGIKELIDDPVDALTRLIFHLKQAGLDIEVDYEAIEEYSYENKLDITTPEISNKKKINFFKSGLKNFRKVRIRDLSINFDNLSKIHSNLNEFPTSELLIVTKNQSQEDLHELLKKGYKTFGENRYRKQNINIPIYFLNLNLIYI